jgi:hypothetical protein
MLDCKDPALTALRSVGYNVVLTPKSDLVPTQLLAANGSKLQRLGDLGTVFLPEPGQAAPKIKFDNPGPNIAITKSQELKVGVGLKILSGLISVLGGSTLGISTAYSRARNVQLEYNDVTVDSAAIADIDIYLSIADITPFGNAVHEMFREDNIYVVTSVIKAKSLTVAAKSESGASLNLDLPVVQSAVGANIDVSAKGSGTSTLTYTGKIPLAFGFQAVRLIADDKGGYQTMKLVGGGGVVLEGVPTGPTGELSIDGLIPFS